MNNIIYIILQKKNNLGTAKLSNVPLKKKKVQMQNHAGRTSNTLYRVNEYE